MKILLIGEASFVQNTLKKGLEERGHNVTTMSDGNNWHNAPRDIDLRRNMKWGKLSGLMVLVKLLLHLPKLIGNDIVQIHNYQFVPLKYKWNTLLFRFLKRFNGHVVKLCLGDDPLILSKQAEGIPRYSDTYWHGKEQNREQNSERIAELTLPAAVDNWKQTSDRAHALVACLYEYWLCYESSPYGDKLLYCGLPIVLPDKKLQRVRNSSRKTLRILVGLQPKRDFMKGAGRIAALVEQIKSRCTTELKIQIKYVEGVPYDEYMKLLTWADVLVDQFYSFTPSMNSLAAMARGTVVIGGGEEEYYQFIGEPFLRPIINVSPELSDEENMAIIEKALFTEGNLTRLSRQSIAFVEKYHDYRKIALQFEHIYRDLAWAL